MLTRSGTYKGGCPAAARVRLAGVFQAGRRAPICILSVQTVLVRLGSALRLFASSAVLRSGAGPVCTGAVVGFEGGCCFSL